MELPRMLQPFARAETTIRRIAVDVAHLLRHVHELKEIVMVTKDELKTQIGEVKTILVEAQKDVGRVADKLDQAVEAGNLDDVSAAVTELRTLAQGIGDRAEQADPETPVEPTPAPSEPTNPQV